VTNPANHQRSPDGEPILRRALPSEAPARTWGGSGSGAECAVCGERISLDQLEYELEYMRAGGRRVSFHVHVECGLESVGRR
jgi:hypothetical protein